ncbi:MAG: type III PLP-dependent enzyme, partial [Rhodospirillales bacterium]|nr:type III PLP-dependent enzyme [Rhodospirillales bacterium]
MTPKIEEFLARRRPETPFLVVDLDVVAENYRTLRNYLPLANIFYAVKANPAPEVLVTLVGEGSSFDAASVPEVDMCLAAGADPDSIS